MSSAFTNQSFNASVGQSVPLSQLLTLSAAASDPSFLVLNGYDRNEYTVGSSASTASFSGNGHTLGFSALGGDARGAGIVFTRDASGHYVNSSFGMLDQLSLTGSTSKSEVTALSLFGTNDASLANKDAGNAIALAQDDASGYLGTLTVVTTPTNGAVTKPATALSSAVQATPFSIAAEAQSFVGSVANRDGCWVMASTIAAEAGASLPVQSAVNMAGAANGEWMLAYNGPAGSTGDWTSSVRTGDMIGFVTAAGTGHITTVVSGAGSTAMVVDNAVFSNAQGAVLNSANDGSANDIIVQAAHAASQEWAGVAASSVVIFRLDTPVVTTAAATLTVAAGGTAALASVFAATDPAGKPVTTYQAYSANAADRFTVGGTTVAANSAATAVTASSLSQIVFDAGASAASDTISVRASNGASWGDWTTITTTNTLMAAAQASGTGDVSIQRFFSKIDGTHFFTASASEAASLEATRSDLSYEGVGLRGYDSATATPSSEAVFRFFDVTDGTHFYTASTAERDALNSAPSSTMKFEGAAFYEDATQQAGDTAVYRFFDTAHGTHLFTQSDSERASILSTRPDLVSEGIAFYAPH